MHARGSGAHGYFQPTKSLSQADQGRVPAGSEEEDARCSRASRPWPAAPDRSISPRDVRGFAVKFYTEEGNFDLVGNNIPVFFIQDAIKFPDLDPRREDGAGPRLPAGGVRARHVLGLRRR